MSELIVHLADSYGSVTVNKDLEKALKSAIERAYETICFVEVSRLKCNKPVVLDFSGLVAVDYDDIQTVIDAAVDAIGFYYGESIDRKMVSVSVKCTILQELEVELT